MMSNTTDFSLCVKCQVASGTLVVSPQPESYTKFLEAVRQRAQVDDADFPAINRRLHQYTAAELVGKAKWHSNCYKDTVNSSKIDRALKAYQRKLVACAVTAEKENSGCNENTVLQRPFTRSACQQLQGDRCFFCGGDDSSYALHEVCSFDVGAQITQIVEDSSNEEWKVRLQPLSPADARAIDVKYHLKCYVKYVQRSGPSETLPASTDECARALCADTEFVARLRVMLSDGQILSMSTVCSIYEQVMKSSGLHRTCTMKEAKAKVLQHLGDEVEFARPHYKQPETICSSSAKNAAIREAAKYATSSDQEMTTIMNAAAIIRRDILNSVSQKWSFLGSLSSETARNRVPLSLQMLVKWILQGTGSGAEIIDEDIERASMRLSQNIMYATKSVRQVSSRTKGQTVRFNRSQSFENDQVLAVAFKVHAYTRSRSLVEYLHRNGHCVNYSRLLVLEDKLAKSVLDNMAAGNEVYIPPNLVQSIPVFYAVDNIDFDEDTADGKHTLHGTMMVAFQTLKNMSHPELLQERQQSSAVNCGTHTIAADSYLRQLKGSVIPTHSPKFKDFSCNKLLDVDHEYREMDTAWLTNRCVGRSLKTVLKQHIPLWAGYNSLVTLDDRPITVVHTLPLLKSPAHEYNTMIDVLKQAQQITACVAGKDSKVVVTFDMDLYIRAVKLQSLRADVYNKYVFRLGELHTVLCSLRAIGSFVENSGIDDAWVQSDIYSPTTCRQILEGKHMKRALDAHVTTMQVLFDLTMELFSVDYADTYQQLQSLCSELLEDGVDSQFSHTGRLHSAMLTFLKSGRVSSDFETFLLHRKDASFMFTFFWTYLELLETLMTFIRASRQGLWLLHLSSLEKLCSLFFSQNRLKYAQYVPHYIAKMHEIEKDDPSVWQEFIQGNFCVKKSSVPFSSIGVDHAIEHVNRSMKVMGGIRGITQKPGALTRFFLIAPELARLSKEAEDLAAVAEGGCKKRHDLSPAAVHRQEQRIAQLKVYMRDNNPLQIDGNSLQNFVTKCVLPSDATADIMNTVSAGAEAFTKFATERLTGDISLWDRMKRMKLKSWTSTGKTSEMKLRKGTVELKENRSLFARLALAAVSRPDINMSDSIGQYEFSCISRTFFAADGSLLPCTAKSQLMSILEEYGTKSPTAAKDWCLLSKTDCSCSPEAVVDGMVVVQQLAATAAVKTCQDIACQFIAVIDKRTEHYNTLHVVFDSYVAKTSLKEATREKRNTGFVRKEYVCSDSTPVTVSFRNFIANTKTKHNLTVYLAAKLLEHYLLSNKVCIVSTSEGAKSNHGDVSMLSSNHEEADTMLILHAMYASAKQQIVHIMSPDTDVFVLSLRRLPQIGPQTCVMNGTGSKRKLVPLQPIYDALGSDMVDALPGFHAFTGCDTTGRFSGKGKPLCWKAFQKVSKAVLGAFTNLGQGLQPTDEDFLLLEEFVCRLYQPKIKETHISRVRWNIFKHVQAEAERLPPTPAALRQHTLRAHYQCMIWCNDIVPVVDLPEPAGYGWSFTDGVLTPIVTTLKPAPEAIVELVRCKCTAGRCRGQCSCFVAGMVCSQMCKCDAHPEMCDNIDPAVHDHDDDNDDTDTLYHFPYSRETADVMLPHIDDVHEDQDVDHVVHLSSIEVDSA